ncbi:MAG: glycoside hydrolase family 15 protein [Actinobacteria bacterium]|nr:glycoside hydrolase family 15 protein [Actinomycetota bacterium]
MNSVRIDDYAFLSDGHAPALVSRNGSVDWWCPPRADQPPVFAGLLDPNGGHWGLEVEHEREIRRRYLPESLVVESSITTTTGEIRLRDALAMEADARGHEVGRRSPHVLLRSIEGIRGRVRVRCEFAPRFEFGLTTPHLRRDDGAVIAEAGPTALRLRSPVALEERDAAATGVFEVAAGSRFSFSVAHATTHDERPFDDPDIDDALANAEQAWASWAAAHPGYDGPRAQLARTSALVLQGLTFKPTGAVLAAATTSLPAAIGSSANWDYRYVWLRDLSLTAQALWIAACPDEADEYLRFIARAAGKPAHGRRVQIMYGVDGRRDVSEHELDHLSGFRDSKPVRVGNAAWDQAQLDVMGEVLDMAHRFIDQLAPLDDRVKQLLVWLANEAADTWQSPDAGMWEARDDQRHYLTSKVMCWVALDRAARLAPHLGEGSDAHRWAETRDEIRDTVLREGWNDTVGAFTGALGSDQLDASVLLLPLVGFMPADDERMVSTIGAIERQLVRDGLVYRWEGDTNGFVLCTYWLVECLALAGRLGRAASLFDQVTARANDLGLFSEQIDSDTGELLGNFPQAFSHVGLINAAWRLDTLAARERELGLPGRPPRA